MMRSSRLLTLALGAILTAAATDAQDRTPFADGLVQLGAGLVDATRPQRGFDTMIMLVEGRNSEGHNGAERVESALGGFLVQNGVRHPVAAADPVSPGGPAAEADPAVESGSLTESSPVAEAGPVSEAGPPAEDADPATPSWREEPTLPAARAVSLPSMFAGDDLGHYDTVHDLLMRRMPREPDPEAAARSVVAADFHTDESEAAATVQLSDEQFPPPPPPAVPTMPESAPSPVPDAPRGSLPTMFAPTPSGVFIDPRYRLSRESSIYTSTCERCRRQYCHSVYAPFGDAVYGAFGRQIHLGSASLMTLYAYDFHPQDTPQQTELTSRGEYQLDKIVNRLQYTPAPIRIQASGNDVLDDARRVRVLEALVDRGIADADGLVVTVRTGDGRTAVELLESSYNLLDAIQARGQTLQGGGTATFSGVTGFGR